MQDSKPSPPGLYDTDFHAWADQQAALLRAGRLDEADIANIAEEIESMGRSEKRELVSRLTVLLVHLLKWAFQPDKRGKSWRLTVRNQRRALIRHLRDNPSLNQSLALAITDAYGDAVGEAARETDLEPEDFPGACPWTYDQMIDADFWPEA